MHKFIFKFSLFLCCSFLLRNYSNAQDKMYEGASPFNFGFARLEVLDGNKTSSQPGQLYIDTTGQVAFDTIMEGNFVDPSQEDSLSIFGDSTMLPTKVVSVQKGNNVGILTVNGHWILKPVYSEIDHRSNLSWRVKKNGKMSVFSRMGFLLPFSFENVYQLDDNYFQVQQHDKWGVYNRKDSDMVIPCLYQDIDYCYGCETKGDYVFAKKNGKWGIIDFHNKVLLPFEYDHEHQNMRSDEWVTSLYKNGKQMIINLQTKEEKVCNCYPSDSENDSTVLAQGFVRVSKGDKYGLLNPEGKLILPYQYDYIRYDAADPGDYEFPAPYVQINKNNHWGVADTTGHILIPPIYTSGNRIELDSFFICEKKAGNDYEEVLFDKTGKRVLDLDYKKIDAAYTYNDSIPYFKLKKKGLYGFYNPATKKLVQPIYEGISDFLFNVQEKNTIKVTLNGNESLIDINTGKVIIPPLYSNIYSQDSLQPHLFIVEKRGKFGVYDAQKQKLIIPLKYDYLSSTMIKDLFKVQNDQRYGFINLKNQNVVPEQYFEIELLDKGYYLLTKQDSTHYNSFSIYDVLKDSIKKMPDSTLEVYGAHLAVIQDDGKAKLWDPLKNKIIEGPYSKNGFPDQINYFDNGWAVSYKNGKYGVIDTLGAVVIPFLYEGLSDFQNGYALVLTGKEPDQEEPPFNHSSLFFLNGFEHYGLIDSTGKVVVPPEYDLQWGYSMDEYFQNNLLILFKGNESGKMPALGLANLKGEIIVPPKFEQIIPIENYPGYLVQKDKKYGVLNSKGQIILPAEFDDIALQGQLGFGTKYKLSFPVLAEKDGVWQYYRKDGSHFPIKASQMIPFVKIDLF